MPHRLVPPGSWAGCTRLLLVGVRRGDRQPKCVHRLFNLAQRSSHCRTCGLRMLARTCVMFDLRRSTDCALTDSSWTSDWSSEARKLPDETMGEPGASSRPRRLRSQLSHSPSPKDAKYRCQAVTGA